MYLSSHALLSPTNFVYFTVHPEHEPIFCRLLTDYDLLENEQFEEPLRYVLESRKVSLLHSFVSILGKSGIKEVTLVKELSTEWYYIMLEQAVTPLYIYELLLSIFSSCLFVLLLVCLLFCFVLFCFVLFFL
jgi:hypothetical protein